MWLPSGSSKRVIISQERLITDHIANPWAECTPFGKAPHPPTGATTFIVSFGFLQTLSGMAGVCILSLVGWIVNRTGGVPVWAVGE